jgi:hypothetical protein
MNSRAFAKKNKENQVTLTPRRAFARHPKKDEVGVVPFPPVGRPGEVGRMFASGVIIATGKG